MRMGLIGSGVGNLDGSVKSHRILGCFGLPTTTKTMLLMSHSALMRRTNCPRFTGLEGCTPKPITFC